MALSDCLQCGDTPCTCGYAYRDSSIEHLKHMRDMFQTLIDKYNLVASNCKHYESLDKSNVSKRVTNFTMREIIEKQLDAGISVELVSECIKCELADGTPVYIGKDSGISPVIIPLEVSDDE